MATQLSPRKARAPPQSRKSVAQLPSPDVNNGKENATMQLSSVPQEKPTSRKPRSKSIGPGGLDALREDAGNRRQSALPPNFKSILKPTIPLSPPKRIPPHAGGQRTSSPGRSNPNASIWKNSNPVSGNHGLPNPFEVPNESTNSPSNLLSSTDSQTRVSVRTEAEQQAAAKERERQEVLAHKDARRKSLANRRVSFAPEATLHTWDVVELPEDSTTSSASPNSTRRASGLSTVAASPYSQPSSDALKPPSTPPEQVEDVQVTASPMLQRDLHQKKRRRSSGIPPMNFNNLDDFSSSPVSEGSNDTGGQTFVTAEEEGESSNSDGDGIEDESTVTGIDVDDVTAQSNGGSSTSSSGRLDQALRQAAAQAGTQGIEYDENGDIPMEMADDEITAAFQPWMKNGNDVPQVLIDPRILQDQENMDPFSEAFKSNLTENTPYDDAEKTMDFTHAVGAILPPHREEVHASPTSNRRKSVSGGRRRSSGASRRSSDDGSMLGDETMDLTTAIGGIQQDTAMDLTAAFGRIEQNQPVPEKAGTTTDSGPVDEHQKLSIESTSVLGAANSQEIQESPTVNLRKNTPRGRRRSSVALRRSSGDGSVFGDATMDLTTAVGVIQQNKPVPEQFEATAADSESVNGDEELTMELTSVMEAAKGLLKRPLELDENDEENLTPRPLKGSEGSPVKRTRATPSSRPFKAHFADNAQVEDMDRTMELTHAIGSILPHRQETQPSPKSNRRKSAILGAAKGILGRRPVELDDEDEEDLTPRRLKGKERSPVKKIRLPAPPSKTETTGRVTQSGRIVLAETVDKNVRTPSKGSPIKKIDETTPKNQLRFKDAETLPSASKPVVSFNQKLVVGDVAVINPPVEDDRIHLQDFLNMTSIRFMELTTTKRRLTVAPSGILESDSKTPKEGAGFSSSVEKVSEFESCVVAGACTVPMLELYQHSCRELKKYIAEGRSIVREIEGDTFEENPPLFREYISAHPEDKCIMDNQFKNVKTHARLLSKAMWYEWRMKLLAGLKDGLLKIGEGMDEDDSSLTQQARILDPVLPGLVEKHEKLEAERQILQSQADEIANCDQRELQDARNNLVAVEKELQSKRKMLEHLQNEQRRKEERFEHAMERKQQCVEEIKEAEKIRQDHRGWSPSEVAALQGNVDALEKAHGWTIISINGTSLTMTYKQTLQLFFDPSSFKRSSSPNPPETAGTENSPISLTYIADAAKHRASRLTTERRFFLQIMRAQLQCLPQCSIRIKDLLTLVSTNWEKASSISDQVGLLKEKYMTEPIIQSDEAMTVRCWLLLREMRTKIELGFQTTVRQDGEAELRIDITAQAKVVYGESLKEGKMAEFLGERIAPGGPGAWWVNAVGELEQRLIRRGRRCAGV